MERHHCHLKSLPDWLLPIVLRTRVSGLNARARTKYGITTTITLEELVAILDAHDWRCVFCNSDEYIVIDHIVSLRQGGTHISTNLQPLCRSCNCSKRDRSVEEALRARDQWRRDIGEIE